MAFLPPLVASTTASVLRTVAVALLLATAMLLHWVFLCIAARRLERSVPGWVSMGVLLFPIGGATALILFGWFDEEARGLRPAPAPAPSPFG
jgi:ABC-type enterochelin transport system permease subunit